MSQIRQHFLISFIFLLACSILFPQQVSGQIRGTVVDSTNDDPLLGANLWLDGTSLGAASDLDGNFVITNVPPGNYNLRVRYIGYNEKELPVVVKSGQMVRMDISLSPTVVEGQEVIVTGQAQGQREAINQQLTSNTIKNVVSAEKIRELPDDNAATALSRLPGVSLMNGDQVVIRGMEAKLNQVLVNGIQMPSTDMNNRSTSLGFVSSNMLAGIEVIKAITPDMDANTIGGVVNLKLREAPSDFHVDVLTQGNYNKSDVNFNNYKLWASVSDRFFDDKFGVFLQGNLDKSDGGNQAFSRGLTIDGSSTYQLGQEAAYLTNSASFNYDRYISRIGGGSLILDYKLPDGKIVFQNTYAGNFTDKRNSQVRLSFDDTRAIFTMDRDKFGRDLWINALQAENFFGDIKVEASLSHSSTQQYTRFAYEPNYPGTGWTDFHSSNSSSAPFGKDANGNIIKFVGAAQRSLTIDKIYSLFDNLNPEVVDESLLSSWVSAVNRIFNQHLYNSSFDVTAPFSFSNDITATFKAGGKYTRTTRENDFDRFFSADNAEDTYRNVRDYFPDRPRSETNRLRFTDIMETDWERGENYLSDEYDFVNGFNYVINTDIYDDWLKKSMAGWASPLKEDDSWRDDWNGSESFAAGYLMGTFNLFEDWTLIAGARYEHYNMDYHAQFTYSTHTVYGDAISTINGSIGDFDTTWHSVPESFYNVNRSDINWFPNVHLRYKVNDWTDIRLAYTSSIIRPDYQSIIPKVFVSIGGGIQSGNPKLRPTTAQNFDVIASFYNNEIGLFTINGFYKELTDAMYNSDVFYGSLSQYANEVVLPDSAFMQNRFNHKTLPQNRVSVSLNNTNTGFIKGVEIGWQTNFWYLPGVLSSLVLDVNYTKSHSNIDYRILQNESKTVRDPISGKSTTSYFTTDTVFTESLIQHANDVVNVALGIDYKGFSTRISFNMRGNVINSIGSRPEETSYTGNIYRWDFTLKQDLPLEGLSISFNGTNIFNNPVKSYRKYRLTPDSPTTENLVSVYYSPTIFQANLRYSF